eukprot:NODE_529_length_7157_cov_0.524795.p5 type:complete len:158 gc:universal NODE_529_length_7157_cov_0.524795:2079-1606(-)
MKNKLSRMLQVTVIAVSASLLTLLAMNILRKSPKVFFDIGSEMKMVLIVRTDLKMTKGKMAAQCCHACLEAFQESVKKYPQFVNAWKRDGQAKIALKCDSQQELINLYHNAKMAGLSASIIRDAGRTQIPSGSITVLAIGPAPISEVDKISGDLKLL